MKPSSENDCDQSIKGQYAGDSFVRETFLALRFVNQRINLPPPFITLHAQQVFLAALTHTEQTQKTASRSLNYSESLRKYSDPKAFGWKPLNYKLKPHSLSGAHAIVIMTCCLNPCNIRTQSEDES